jgi:uracil-DNA glycosylase
MRTTLLALTEELRRLKAAGVKSVSVSTESLDALRARVRARAAVAAEAKLEGAVAAAPESPRAAAAPVASGVPDLAAYAPPRTTATRTPVKAEPRLPRPPVINLPPGDKATRWAWLRDQVLQNPVCREQAREGGKVVFGVGQLDAPLFFCGEAPGAEEEQQGEPFVGPAGQLLTKMIQAMGLQRSDVYIANIMNWRPALPTAAGGEQIGNRPPTAEEMAYCLPYLCAQIEVVQPKLIIALGATAAKGLLGPDSFKAVGEVRGRWHTFAETPLMVTYHPSYILRNQSNRSKRMIWEDLLKVMEKAGLPISAKQQGYFLDK